MPIDTAAKRASATLFIVPSMAPGVFPDGTIDQGDRQASTWCYSGILAAGAAPPEPEPEPTPGTGGTTRQDHRYRPRLPRKKYGKPTFRYVETEPEKEAPPTPDKKIGPLIQLDRYGLTPKPPTVVVFPKTIEIAVEIGQTEVNQVLMLATSILLAEPIIIGAPEIYLDTVTLMPKSLDVGAHRKDEIGEDDAEIMLILRMLNEV